MQEPINTFALSPEQQDTAAKLRRLLGKGIADRYVDFCRLAAGGFPLIVSRPIAAHALRELDSTLRHVLAVPLEAKVSLTSEDTARQDEARKQLRALGYEFETVNQASKYLKPSFTHRDQIRKIVARLGLDPAGDIANKWASLSDIVGKAHERAFHRSLVVDDEFRTRYQQPFDTVIRAIAVALEGRYATLMRRVEEISAMPNQAIAAAAFASEIPEAMPLQWHFFKSLTTGDWLPHLARHNLLGEPLMEPEEAVNGFRDRQWPAGHYLRRMAESPNLETRKRVAQTLRAIAASKHPDVHQSGLEILAALPPEESAPLADMAVAWLGRESRFGFLQAPENLLKRLAEGNQCVAALAVGRALLQIWDENGQIASLYGRHMYEHHLPAAMKVLTKACGLDALRLFIELLVQAGDISGRSQYDHHSSRPVTDDELANHDTYNALISAVRRSAEILITESPGGMRHVVKTLTDNPAKIFLRLALHMLAINPMAAPELADAYLFNPELIEQTWARHEYGELARAWFPSLSSDNQRAVLAVVDALPGKYRVAWHARFMEINKTPPTSENERVFSALTIRDVQWEWRSVLPPERQQALTDIVTEIGDPDAWRRQLFPPEESPRSSAEFSMRPVSARLCAFYVA